MISAKRNAWFGYLIRNKPASILMTMRLGQIVKPLAKGPNMLPENIHADELADLSAEIFTKPDKIHPTLRRLIIGNEIDKGLLHGSQHAVPVDDIPKSPGYGSGLSETCSGVACWRGKSQ